MEIWPNQEAGSFLTAKPHFTQSWDLYCSRQRRLVAMIDLASFGRATASIAEQVGPVVASLL